MEQKFGPEYADFLELLGELRQPVSARYPSSEARKALWTQLLDSDVLDLLRNGQPEQARRLAAQLAGLMNVTTQQTQATEH